jgi:hypothetical protein
VEPELVEEKMVEVDSPRLILQKYWLKPKPKTSLYPFSLLENWLPNDCDRLNQFKFISFANNILLFFYLININSKTHAENCHYQFTGIPILQKILSFFVLYRSFQSFIYSIIVLKQLILNRYKIFINSLLYISKLMT